MNLFFVGKFSSFAVPSRFVECDAKAMYIATLRIHVTRLLETVDSVADAGDYDEDNQPLFMLLSS